MTPPRRILVVVTRRIGDVLLATPLIRSVKNAWPAAAVDVLVFAGSGGVLQNNPDVARVLAIAERPGWLEHLRLIFRVARRYDVALSLVPGDRPTLYAWAAGKWRAGLLLGTRKESWKRRLLSRWIPFDPLNTHTLLMHLALADALGIARCHEIALNWSTADEEHVRASLPFDPAQQAFAVLHVFPKFNYKMWHRDGWIELARNLADRNLRLVLSGSNGADELAYVNSLAADLPVGTVNLAGVLSLPALGFLLSRARLYVGPDTAVTHMAAALGTPTVACYGPTDPVKWGPWPKGYAGPGNPWQRQGTQALANVRLIQGTGSCVPCLLEGCYRRVDSFSDCLQTLPAHRVIAAADELLRQGARHDRVPATRQV